MKKSTTDHLDRFYAGALGCTPDDLNSNGPVIVVNKRIGDIRFAKGRPLALFSMDKGPGPVVSLRPPLDRVVTRLDEADFQRLIGGTPQKVLALSSAIRMLYWFEGVRLNCDTNSFVNYSSGEVRDVTGFEPRAAQLHQRWGGPVFGQIVGGEVVARAAVKIVSDVVWDLRVETVPEHQGRGYAKSVVSAALRYIFDHRKLAGWGTDRSNEASLRTARAVGFRDYALEFGCVEEEQNVDAHTR